jgi:hypothetical protein
VWAVRAELNVLFEHLFQETRRRERIGTSRSPTRAVPGVEAAAAVAPPRDRLEEASGGRGDTARTSAGREIRAARLGDD